jgi:hypothetical protein
MTTDWQSYRGSNTISASQPEVDREKSPAPRTASDGGIPFFSKVLPKSDGLTTQVICQRCGSYFTIAIRYLLRGGGKYCCLRCANSRFRNPDWRKQWLNRNKDTPLWYRQRRAGHLVERAVRRGALIRKPCEVCGHVPTEAHHEDYDKPFDVRWLCHSHHQKHDRNRIVR